MIFCAEDTIFIGFKNRSLRLKAAKGEQHETNHVAIARPSWPSRRREARLAEQLRER